MNKDLHKWQECSLCPRLCGVNRNLTNKGYCGQDKELRYSHMLAHHGEEPCFVGEKGSGTIFFSGCSCHCFFCQNQQISHDGIGLVHSYNEFYDDVKSLISRGVSNLNFVTPDHVEPYLKKLVKELRSEGFDLPVIWNSSGYHRPELVDDWAEYVDIFLPDFKFSDSELAKYCMGDENYPRLSLASLIKMIEHKGFLHPCEPGSDVLAKEGVLVRHLVLPGEVENSLNVLRILKKEFGVNLPISLMSQYCPTLCCKNKREFGRKVTAEEYGIVCDLAMELGFNTIYIQEDGGDDLFLPDFKEKNPFLGNK